MDVRLKPFDFAQAATRAGMPQVAERVRASAKAAGLTDAPEVDSASAVAGGQNVGFQSALTQALRSVSDSQNTTTAMQREVSLDNPTVSIEQTMIATQKSQVGFQAALQIRSRLVQAYNDIMNMSI